MKKKSQCNASSSAYSALLAHSAHTIMRRTTKCAGSRRKYTAPRRTFEEVIQEFSAWEFYWVFRLSFTQFNIPLELVRPLISRFNDSTEDLKKEASLHERRLCTQASAKLGAFLMLLGGTNLQGIFTSLSIPQSSMYDIVREVIDAIVSVMSFPSFPSTLQQFREQALNFACSRPYVNPLPGCVGAIDGITIAIEKPKKQYNPVAFFCRKGYYAIPVQALVDSNYMFMAASAFCTGSTHDSAALDMSNIGRALRHGIIPKGYWISSDDAYFTSETLLTPFRKGLMSKFIDAFNYFFSSLRGDFEQASGQLTQKFRILKAPLAFSLPVCTQNIKVCALLHNFCKQSGGRTELSSSSPMYDQASEELRTWLLWQRYDLDEGGDMCSAAESMRTKPIRRAMQLSRTRACLLRRLERHGILEPRWVS